MTGARANARSSSVTGVWGGSAGGWAVLVHGGAGARSELDLPVAACRTAAAAAAVVLRAGGSALDAVERAVCVLEDDPSLNAGTGACLDEDGGISLDAAIMEGAGLRAGAVCALPPFLHPVSIARAALEDGRHVLYAAEGAARFAEQHGFVRATLEAMTTPGARARWEALHARGGGSGGAPGEIVSMLTIGESGRREPGQGGGTVGAVARDLRGTVAAATSTGGLVGKRVGRVGDSPQLGAGTYADDGGGACSATGHGESILRMALAKSAIDAMRGGASPEQAARAVMEAMAERVGGTGGVILVDRAGALGLARNTAAMPWAAASATLGEASGA